MFVGGAVVEDDVDCLVRRSIALDHVQKTYVPWCGLAVLEEMSGIKTRANDPFLDWVAAIGGHELLSHEVGMLAKAADLIAIISAGAD